MYVCKNMEYMSIMVNVRRELAIIQFCAVVARYGFINDVVDWSERKSARCKPVVHLQML